MGSVHTGDATRYGYSDTEVGVKYRFMEETESIPQIGVFPLVELPTGDEKMQLGSGNIQACLPVWFQKSWGKFTTYGGGGLWINSGDGRRNWFFTGWEAQYDLSRSLTIGGELDHQTANGEDARGGMGFSIGGLLNLNEMHPILFSFRRSEAGESVTSGYIAYQLTI